MTSGKADQLKRVADAVVCVKCHVNPRFGSLARCKQCLKADAEVERVARKRLLPAQPAARSNRQQAVASRAAARKPLAIAPTVPAGKALMVTVRPALPAVVTPVAAEPVREMGKPFGVAKWQSMITEALKRFRVAGVGTQTRMAERNLAAETIAENVHLARLTYGDNPLVMMQPRSNAGLSLVHRALLAAGVRIDVVDVFGAVDDIRTVCERCGARVKVPCNESRARSCQNRSRGNR